MILRLAKLAGSVAAFAAGLTIGCWAIGRALPIAEVAEVQPKLEYLRHNPAKYDTLLFGSSRIYHQIVPEIFDGLTAEAGMPTKTFNAAIDGMRQPELNYYVDRVLRLHPQGLKWVFIEAGGLHPQLDADKRGTIRAVYWHDLPRMWLVLRSAIASYKPPRKWSWRSFLNNAAVPFDGFTQHLGPFFENFSNLGRANEYTEPLLLKKEHRIYWPFIGKREDGFIVTGRPEEITPENRKSYEAALERRRLSPPVADYGDAVSQDSFEGMLRAFEKIGAKTVLVIPPTTDGHKFHLLPERLHGRLVLDYSDLAKYQELYTLPNRLDTDHLNTVGSEIFTRLFTREFCAAAHPAP